MGAVEAEGGRVAMKREGGEGRGRGWGRVPHGHQGRQSHDILLKPVVLLGRSWPLSE